MKMTLPERYARLMDDLGFEKDTELAKFAGVSRGAIQQWKKAGPDATIAPIPAYTIAGKTNFEPMWLMLGEGPIYKAQGDERKIALCRLFDATDSRGKDAIFRTAESQPIVDGEDVDKRKDAA